ncbi:hypothetical protein D3C85_1426450 [compost metagenome]
MSQHPHRADGAAGICADHHANGPTVAVGGHGFQRIAGVLPLEGRGVERHGLIAAQVLAAGDQPAAGHQIVVIAPRRQQGFQGAQLLQLLLVGDAIPGQLVGQHHHGGAGQGEQGQGDAVFAHAL